MTTVLYDGSFIGLLTSVFEIYEYKISEPNLVKSGSGNFSLFGEKHDVISCEEKADRVLKKIKQNLSYSIAKKIYEAHLSEEAQIADVIFRFIKYGLNNGKMACDDFSNADVLHLHQILKKVHRERHRMEAFIRFQLADDGLFFATVAPDFDVLPLIVKHFKSRYADQRWIIYDTKRSYGIIYDLKEVNMVENVKATPENLSIAPAVNLHKEEENFQELWKHYFNSVNIKERKNMKLHVKHMPKRYWKFLTEKH